MINLTNFVAAAADIAGNAIGNPVATALVVGGVCMAPKGITWLRGHAAAFLYKRYVEEPREKFKAQLRAQIELEKQQSPDERLRECEKRMSVNREVRKEVLGIDVPLLINRRQVERVLSVWKDAGF